MTASIPQTVGSDISRFLSTLHGEKSDELYMYTWVLPTKRSHWYNDVQQAIVETQEAYSQDTNDAMYTGVSWSQTNLGANKRVSANDAAGMPALWIDLDVAGEGHKKQNLPATIDEASEFLIAVAPKPTILVNSGHGLQAWWLFPEPWIFESGADRERAEKLALRWNNYIRETASKQHGWSIDAVHDLARVMRIPGTWNRKENSEPVMATLTSNDGELRYSRAMFAEYMAESSEVESKPKLTIVKGGRVDPIIDPQIGPPYQKWEALCEAEPRALRAFQRKIKTLEDQSPSTYDMALAGYAVAAGFTDQEICNLLVAARVKNHEDLKRPDYYRRTIDRARLGHAQNKQTTELVERVKDDEKPMATDEALETLRNLVGIPDLRIRQFAEKTRRYDVMVGDTYVNIGPIAKLFSQAAFSNAVAEQARINIPKFKRDEWDAVKKLMTQVWETQEIDEDATEEGEARNWITYYLDHHSITQNADDASENGLAYDVNSRVYIFSTELHKFINTSMGESVSSKTMGIGLRLIGCKGERLNVRISGKMTTRYAWRLPGAASEWRR